MCLPWPHPEKARRTALADADAIEGARRGDADKARRLANADATRAEGEAQAAATRATGDAEASAIRAGAGPAAVKGTVPVPTTPAES